MLTCVVLKNGQVNVFMPVIPFSKIFKYCFSGPCFPYKSPFVCAFLTDAWFIFLSSIWASSFMSWAVNADLLSVKIASVIYYCCKNPFIKTFATTSAEGEVIG